jgi:acetyl-CoA acetyltransferase
LAGNPLFAAGLVRIGEAARHIADAGAARVLAHATSGPALQHNLVCVMEGR